MTIQYRKILVPLDGSELAEAAVAHVMYLAPLSGADALLLGLPVHSLSKVPFSPLRCSVVSPTNACRSDHRA